MGAESIQGAVLAKDARRARTAARGRSLLRARALLRGRAALLCAAAAAALAGCGGAGEGRPPQLGVRAGDDEAAAKLGFPAAATRNTVRVGGGDAVADAAAVARIFYPAATTATRPRAVVLIDSRRWQDAVSAAPLAGDPLAAPLLFATGGDIPAVTRDALASLRPLGSDLADDAQVIVVGDGTPAPANLRIRRLRGEDPYAVAAEIDRFAATVRRKPSPRVVIFSGERPEWAMPAAAWAAFSGDAALPVRATTVPAPIRRALARREGEAQIFLLGPESVLPRALERKLRSFGRVRRVGARAPQRRRSGDRLRPLPRGRVRLGRRRSGLQPHPRQRGAPPRRRRRGATRYQGGVRATAPHRPCRHAAASAPAVPVEYPAGLRRNATGLRLQPRVDPGRRPGGVDRRPSPARSPGRARAGATAGSLTTRASSLTGGASSLPPRASSLPPRGRPTRRGTLP